MAKLFFPIRMSVNTRVYKGGRAYISTEHHWEVTRLACEEKLHVVLLCILGSTLRGCAHDRDIDSRKQLSQPTVSTASAILLKLC